jgi:hypothetical protein
MGGREKAVFSNIEVTAKTTTMTVLSLSRGGRVGLTEQAAEVLFLGLGVVHVLGENLLLLGGICARCRGAEAVAHAPARVVALVVAALATSAVEAAAGAAAEEDDGTNADEDDGELGVDCKERDK